MTLLDTMIVKWMIDKGASDRYPDLLRDISELSSPEGFATSFITQYEMRRGVEDLLLRERKGGRRSQVVLRRFLDSIPVLGLDALGGEGWNVAARLWAESKAHGALFGDRDLLIVATASFHGRTLLTADERLAASIDRLATALGRPDYPVKVHVPLPGTRTQA